MALLSKKTILDDIVLYYVMLLKEDNLEQSNEN